MGPLSSLVLKVIPVNVSPRSCFGSRASQVLTQRHDARIASHYFAWKKELQNAANPSACGRFGVACIRFWALVRDHAAAGDAAERFDHGCELAAQDGGSTGQGDG